MRRHITAYNNKRHRNFNPFLKPLPSKPLLSYFLDLSETSNFKWFDSYWCQIKDCELNSSDLSQIIYNVSHSIISLSEIDPDLSNNLKFYIQSNLDVWLNPAMDKIDKFNEISLSKMLRSFSKLKVSLPDDFLDRWQNVAAQKIYNFSCSDLLNMIMAFIELDIQPSYAFMDAWESSSIVQMDYFNPQAIANSISSFSKLRIVPSPEFISSWICAATDQISILDERDLSNIVLSFSILNIIPNDAFMGQLFDNATQKIDTFTPQGLVNTYWGMAVLDAAGLVHQTHIQNLREAIEEKIEGLNIDMPAFHHAKHCASIHFNNASALRVDFFNSESAHSSLETIFYQKLCDSKVGNIERSYSIPELLYEGDFVQNIDDKKRIFIEVDGPTHFVRDSQGLLHYNGNTKFMSSLIQKICPNETMIRFPFGFINYLQLNELNAIFSQAAGIKSGVYVLDRSYQDGQFFFSKLIPS